MTCPVNYSIATDIGAWVVGVAVDSGTGYVYCTTSRNSWQVEAWDTSAWPLDPAITPTPFDFETQPAGRGPSGICIGSNSIYLDKQSNIPTGQTAGGGDEITYTITYGPAGYDHTNVIIKDHFPQELTLISSLPPFDYIDMEAGALVWDIGSIAQTDANGSIIITAVVNKSIGHNTTFTNQAEIESDTSYAMAQASTAVGDWEDPDSVPGVIYVDQRANGYNNGTSWANAYNDLQDGLWRAETRLELAQDPNTAIAEIWVAAGRYSPGPAVWTDYFDIPAGCEVYGGFAGLETARTQRQWSRYRTYLDGHGLNRKIVNITNANDLANPVILDGFYLHQARMFAIAINNSSPIISHCVLINNNAGIDIDSNSQPIIANNVIAINDQSGISFNAAPSAMA